LLALKFDVHFVPGPSVISHLTVVESAQLSVSLQVPQRGRIHHWRVTGRGAWPPTCTGVPAEGLCQR